MKKQILTIAMCLALTGSSAMAECAKTAAASPCPVAKTTSTMPIKIQAQVAPGGCLSRLACPSKISCEDAKKHFEERKAKEREKMYTDLGLSAEQRAKADEQEAKNKTEAMPLFQKFKIESKKLCDLKAKNASGFEILEQEAVVKASKKALRKHHNESRKSFEAILTKEQKVKFEARKKEMKKFRKDHKHGCKNHRCPEGGCPAVEGMGPEPMAPATEAKK